MWREAIFGGTSGAVRHGRRIGVAAALLATLAGCAAAPRMVAPPPAPLAPAWTNVAGPDDSGRLANLEALWRSALAEAGRRRGLARRLAAEGALLDPARRLPRAMPSPGPYRCRTLRLGEASPRAASLSAASGLCYVVHEGELLSLTRQDGRERPGGYLWEDGRDRMIFLGALAVGREPLPPAYRDRPERDLIGVIERIGPFRYRLVLLHAAARIDVVELVPALTG